jgi:hypothetical protein
MVALLDDHLLRDLLADDLSTELAEILGEHEPATTNLPESGWDTFRRRSRD